MLLGPALEATTDEWDRGVRESAEAMLQSIVPLRPDDIGDAVSYIVTRDGRVAVNEMLVRAAEQTW